MIKSITIENYVGDKKKFELTKPEESHFNITSIEGLGPVKASVNFTYFASLDGAKFNSAFANPRNIVINFLFVGSPTIEDTRLESYKYFPLKQRCNITIETDTRVVETYGIVESNEPDIFSKKEGCQISIKCPDSYFYSSDVVNKVFFGAEPMFEFPFENPVGERSLIMGDIYNREQRDIFYEGDAEVGVTIMVECTGNVDDLIIYNFVTREIMRIDKERLRSYTGSALKAKDRIEICTVNGNKYIHLLRDGITTNIVNCLNRDAGWFQLRRGDNLFAYTASPEGSDNVRMRISYNVAYEGV